LTTSYDTRNNLALQYLSAMYGVEFRMVTDLRRNPCTRCNETGAITTARVCGDNADTGRSEIECCISCLDGAVRKANTELRAGAEVRVEVPTRLNAFEGDVVEVHPGTSCMRYRVVLDPAHRYVITDRVRGLLLVRAEGTAGPDYTIRFANIALICTGAFDV
jgi:hypothetical protein